MAVVGVIPAAGHATRLQPLRCSKEVYPIAGRPVMDYLIERMHAAPCADIRVVTRPEKGDVAAYARSHGATVVEARPASLAESLLLGLDGLDPDDVVLIGFPDSIWEPVDAYARVLELIDDGWEVALGLFKPAGADLPRHEPVVTDESGRVRRIEFKPERPGSSWMWGCAAVRAGVLRGLTQREEPGRFFGALASAGRVGGVRLSGGYLDMGTPDGLRAALNGGNPSTTAAVLLGSGGWIPTSRRETCCAFLRRGERALLIDAGTGVSRLVENQRLLAGVESLDIVLTHFHLDHVVGLGYLPALVLSERPRLHGPGGWLYETATAEVLARLMGSPLFALELHEVVSAVEEIGPAGKSIGPFDLAVRLQERHNDPTVAFRLDDELAYCTDTAHDPGNAEFAAGCGTLLHEAWCTEAKPRDLVAHSAARQAAEVAAAAGAGGLVLIHVRPDADGRELEREAAAVFPGAVVGRDLVPLERA